MDGIIDDRKSLYRWSIHWNGTYLTTHNRVLGTLVNYTTIALYRFIQLIREYNNMSPSQTFLFQQYQYDRRSYYNTVPCGFTWYNHIHIRSPNIRVTLTVTGTVCRGVWLRKFTISTSQWPIIMCIPTAPAKKVTIQDTFNLARLLDV